MKIKKLVCFLLTFIIVVSFSTQSVFASEWVKTDKGYSYKDDDGNYAKKGWLNVNGKKYYIKSDGTRKTGWLKTKKATYYFDKNGVAVTEWQYINKEIFYFDENNKMITGRRFIDGFDYRFDDNGKLVYLTEIGDVLYEDEDIKITYQGFGLKDEDLGEDYVRKYVTLLVENKSNKKYDIHANEMSINDCMVVPIYSCNVLAKSKAYKKMYLGYNTKELKECGVTEILDIKFTLVLAYDLKDIDSWVTSDFITISL